jgi:hypothetical protein
MRKVIVKIAEIAFVVIFFLPGILIVTPRMIATGGDPLFSIADLGRYLIGVFTLALIILPLSVLTVAVAVIVMHVRGRRGT